MLVFQIEIKRTHQVGNDLPSDMRLHTALCKNCGKMLWNGANIDMNIIKLHIARKAMFYLLYFTDLMDWKYISKHWCRHYNVHVV